MPNGDKDTPDKLPADFFGTVSKDAASVPKAAPITLGQAAKAAGRGLLDPIEGIGASVLGTVGDVMGLERGVSGLFSTGHIPPAGPIEQKVRAAGELPESFMGKVGYGAGVLGQIAGAEAPLELIPTRARAMEKFGRIAEAAKGLPVDISRAGEKALDMVKLFEAGDRPLPAVARAVAERATDPTKAATTYEEARRFYTPASRATRKPPVFQRLLGTGASPTMRRVAGQMTGELDEAIRGALGKIGQAEEYGRAMKQYAQASKVREIAGKVLPPIAGALTYEFLRRPIYRLFGHEGYGGGY